MKGKAMKTPRFVLFAWVPFTMAVNAETILWHHFDERSPGETAQTTDVFVNSASSDYSNGAAYSINTGTTLGSDPAFMPTFAPPCYREAIYDPVSGEVYTNTASISFRTEGTSSALAGGAVVIQDDPALRLTNFTVECFVCTTGGAFNLIAPIVGKINNGGFTSEAWQIGVLQNGKMFMRFNRQNTATGGEGTHVITNGDWHHVAITCSYDKGANQSTYTMYVDYEQDIQRTLSAPIAYTTTGNNNIYVGGYQNEGRKFNGQIDELRLTDTVLSPNQFLRRVLPPFISDETLVWLPFDGTNGTPGTVCRNYASSPVTATLKKKGDAPDSIYSNDVVSATLRDDCSQPPSWDNATSLFLQTNGTAGNGSYLSLKSYAYAATDLTVEMFFKTAGKMKSGESQTLFKISDSPVLQVTLDNTHPGQIFMVYCDQNKASPWTHAGDVGSDLDDGKWHHMAVVYDSEGGTLKFYVDYVLLSSATGVKLSTASVLTGVGGTPTGGQLFHGWIDSVRFTKRALAPSSFLFSSERVYSVQEGLLFHAQFDGDYEAFTGEVVISGKGYAHDEGAGDTAPTFSDNVKYAELLSDGAGGSNVYTNEGSICCHGSTVFFPYVTAIGKVDHTAELFCKLSSLPKLAGVVRVNASSGGIDYGTPVWAFYSGDLNRFTFRFATVTNGYLNAERYLNTTIPLSRLCDDTWHHLGITVQSVDDGANTRVTVYIDGEQEYVGTISGTLYSTAGNSVAIGSASQHADGAMTGSVDEVRIMRGVLPPSRFLCRYKRPKGLVMQFR